MGKNILVVRGGGRPRGNTAQLAESFAKGDFALVNYIGFNNKRDFACRRLRRYQRAALH